MSNTDLLELIVAYGKECTRLGGYVERGLQANISYAKADCEAALKRIEQALKASDAGYTDIVSDGGMDPRNAPRPVDLSEAKRLAAQIQGRLADLKAALTIDEPTLRAEFERQHAGRNLSRHALRGTYISATIAALWNQHVRTAKWLVGEK